MVWGQEYNSLLAVLAAVHTSYIMNKRCYIQILRLASVGVASCCLALVYIQVEVTSINSVEAAVTGVTRSQIFLKVMGRVMGPSVFNAKLISSRNIHKLSCRSGCD